MVLLCSPDGFQQGLQKEGPVPVVQAGNKVGSQGVSPASYQRSGGGRPLWAGAGRIQRNVGGGAPVLLQIPGTGLRE